jgi:DNA-binding XRE family transcriptional regulator
MKYVELGKFLSETRLNLGYSQEMVADIIGVTDKTIRNIEYGITAADLITVMRLWDLYEISHDILFKYYERCEEMKIELEFYQEKIKALKQKRLVKI